MSERITKDMAKNIYFGGGLFAILIFMGLTFDSVHQIKKLSNDKDITRSVAHGKRVWENNNCIGCHTILGEGAYYAPELGNAFIRLGNSDEKTFKTYLSAWMKAQPLAVPDRRKMPQFNLTKKEIDDLADFLIWTSKIDTQSWPPNIKG
jgi:nitric oxide reductase subunit C